MQIDQLIEQKIEEKLAPLQEKYEKLLLQVYDEVWTFADVMKELAVSRSTLYSLMRDIPHFKKGGIVRFLKSDIIHYMKENRTLTSCQLERLAIEHIARLNEKRDRKRAA